MDHIPLIVELHAEDAAILWLQRDRAVDAPHFNRMFLSRLDERIEAHLDGLFVAGRAGWDVARAAYDRAPEPGEAFVLGALAFGAASARGIGEVLEIVDGDEGGLLRRAVVSALGWLDPAQLRGQVQPLLDDPRPRVRALGLGACSAHRVDPGDQLAGHLEQAPPVHVCAVTLAGELGRADLAPRIAACDVPTSEGDAFATARASVLLGQRGAAVDVLRHFASRPGPDRREALELAALAMAPEDLRTWIAAMSGPAETLAVLASGPTGLPDLVPWLIDRAQVPALARFAGESISTITGVDLAFLDLDRPAPPGEAPNDDPADDRVDLDPDLDLPVPDPAALTGWWLRAGVGHSLGKRHFLGAPATKEVYLEGFDRGYQRQRRIAAEALALADPRQPLLNWRMRERARVRWKHRAAP